MTSEDRENLVVFRCIPVDQPIGAFYIGAMNAQDIVAISWADVRRIAPNEEPPEAVSDKSESPPSIAETDQPPDAVSNEGGSLQNIAENDQLPDEGDFLDEAIVRYEDQGFEEFLGIQRELSTSRVSELRQYVQNVDATFPTAVLLAVSSEHANFDEETSQLSIVRHSKAAKIIDGQHRIAGLKNVGDTKFQVNVAIFIDMDIQDQAMVFATINLKQTKVNKSLAYDLYEFTTSRSPQRTCHDIARFLNYRQSSPFHEKIKMLGVGRGPNETITQSTFVDRLMRFISTNPMQDRDLLRRGKRLEPARGVPERRQIFRNLFIREDDHIIALILWNFFLAVQRKWPSSWQDVQRGNILNRTTGLGALMRFMRVAYLSMNASEQVVKADEYLPILERIELDDGAFTPDRYLPGSSGERALFNELLAGSKLQDVR